MEAAKYLKSIIYGGLDGIITIFAMVSSSSGASISSGVLLVMGIANLVADAFSMSISDYLSSKAEIEMRETQSYNNFRELENPAELEKKKMFLFRKFVQRGYTTEESDTLVELLSKDRQILLNLISIDDLDQAEELSPLKSATVTFFSFFGFGFLPLMTYLLLPQHLLDSSTETNDSLWIATFLTCCTLSALGLMKAKLTRKDPFLSAVEMILLGGLAAAIAYAIAWTLSSDS